MARRAIAIEAELDLRAGADPRAPGGAVTVALCGHWEHEGPCRWPHNNRIDTSTAPAKLRTVAIVDDETAAEVTTRIETGLRDDGRWAVLACRVVDVAGDEQELARRLAGTV